MQARNSWLTALVIIAVIVGLYLIDRDLAGMEHNELASEAETYFQRAERLQGENRSAAAVEFYRRALILERTSARYQIALSRALIRSGRRAEAAPILNRLLTTDPNNGPANLEVARLLAGSGDTTGAAASWHRAIYGTWPPGSEEQIAKARLELVNMLAREHRNRELMSELLLLEDTAQNNPSLQEQIARWYLSAGSPARAAEAFREVIAAKSATADTYEGLGDAELALGNYRAAQEAYSGALRRGHKSVSQRLLTTVELVQLDPTVRRLNAAERTRRSQLVLQRAMHLLDACRSRPDVPAAPDTKESEEMLGAAEEIWRYTGRVCPNAGKSDAALTALMNRLAQQP